MRLGVSASTFPRWAGDAVPAFVLEHVRALAPRVASVEVVAPHYPGAATRESLGEVAVRRFRYWWPASGETVAYGQYGGGALAAAKGVALTLAQVAAMTRMMGRVDVVNAHWLVPQGFAAVLAGRLRRRPVVVSVHGGDVFTLTGGLSRKVKQWTLRRADAVVANSSATLEVCRSLQERDYEVIPMGVEDRYAQPGAAPATGGFRLLFVGRLADGKGVDDAIRAVGRARRAGVDVELVVAGDGPLRSDLEELARAEEVAPSVTFLGWVDAEDLPGHLAAAHAFIGPSHTTERGWREAYGLVFVEAALAARPAIGTRNGGITDIVVDGETGLLVPERDVEALAGAIATLAADRATAQEMGRCARRRALATMTWPAVAERYARVLDRVLEEAS
ncbi:glycosyltransferase [Phycicoccus endophyticus]|uniref:D-inositol 3-phosphate glycosyltransferase n=1 Tax=Phycicoccus endophyticus TaxID=1690220 RepID=A0A7G9R322_9MICO|nr:glycosyltransferase [Phycicoccus endophyticus]NHI20292.1 glycosyltransferase family 4 protein [Phycicoccus endophyticus]QNN49997.1 glycosyltransferase [Phycicoccus endophyticus]GGL28976.1 glycosyl transferase family 1 [Phycicoccus endophyticus]